MHHSLRFSYFWLFLLISGICIIPSSTFAESQVSIPADNLLTSDSLPTMDSPTSATLQPGDLEVMMAVRDFYLRKPSYLFDPKQKGAFVIILPENDTGKVKYGLFGPDTRTTGTLTQHFSERNAKASRLRKIVAYKDLRIISLRKHDDLLNKDLVSETFPESKGFLYAWLPGYNKNKSEAIIYVFHAGTDGLGMDMWGEQLELKLHQGKWRVISVMETWRT